MKCVSYTRTMPWKNHTGELTIADQNQRIAEYLAEHLCTTVGLASRRRVSQSRKLSMRQAWI